MVVFLYEKLKELVILILRRLIYPAVFAANSSTKNVENRFEERGRFDLF